MRFTAVAAAALSVAVLASSSGSALGAESVASAFRRVVVARGLDEPLQVTAPRSERNRLYVVEQRGTVRVIDRGKLRKGFVLDVDGDAENSGEPFAQRDVMLCVTRQTR